MKGRLSVVSLAAVVAIATALPASAQQRRPYNAEPNSLRLRIGQFQPDGDSQYWEQREFDFTGSVEDFDDVVFGADYVHMLTERFGIMVTSAYYEGENTAAFLDFEDDLGFDIVHDTTLEILRFDVGMVYHFLRRDAAVSPYAGAGFGLYGYDLEESGDFIDFDAGGEIFSGTFTASGNTVGTFLLAGIEIPVTPQFAFFGEGRWHWVEDELDDDFEDFGDIDLGGVELAGGLSFRF
jgi:outer membrane protein W